MKYQYHLVLALCLCALAVFAFVPAASAHSLSHQSLRQSGVHVAHARPFQSPSDQLSIIVQGNIDQAIQFSFPGELFVVPTLMPGSSHPFDICLDTNGQGNPSTQAGEITLDTDSACVPGTSTPVDLGSLSYDQNTQTATFQVDPNASSLDVNMIGTGAGFEEIVGGTMQLQFTLSDSGQVVNVSGQINVSCNSPGSVSQPDTYTATVSGN